ncbi:hypothetical protein L6R52_20950 [Myxococcota bacterium]|nr:hypothetical protein [Myxococcota bacterium]
MERTWGQQRQSLQNGGQSSSPDAEAAVRSEVQHASSANAATPETCALKTTKKTAATIRSPQATI